MGCLPPRQPMVGKTDLLSHRVFKALVKYGSKHRGLTLGRGSMRASRRVYLG